MKCNKICNFISELSWAIFQRRHILSQYVQECNVVWGSFKRVVLFTVNASSSSTHGCLLQYCMLEFIRQSRLGRQIFMNYELWESLVMWISPMARCWEVGIPANNGAELWVIMVILLKIKNFNNFTSGHLGLRPAVVVKKIVILQVANQL